MSNEQTVAGSVTSLPVILHDIPSPGKREAFALARHADGRSGSSARAVSGRIASGHRMRSLV